MSVVDHSQEGKNMIEWSFAINVAIGIWLAVSFFMAPAVFMSAFIRCREEGYGTAPTHFFTAFIIVAVAPFIIAFEFNKEHID